MESRDPYTIGHSKKVAYYAKELAEFLQLTPCKVYEIYLGALLHDLGKLSIPEHILSKKGELNNKELMIVKTHSEEGYKLINKIKVPWNIKDVILYHHERWDGNGYPKKLAGEEIPLSARIVTIADSIDAMLSDRVYRKAFSVEDVISELKREAGKQFDPTLVKKFIELYNSGKIKFVKNAPDIDFSNKIFLNNCNLEENENVNGQRKTNENIIG